MDLTTTDMDRIKVIVVNENTLAELIPGKPGRIHVLSARATKKVKSRFFNYNGQYYFDLWRSDTTRLATEQDFDEYRVLFEGQYNDPEKYEFELTN